MTCVFITQKITRFSSDIRVYMGTMIRFADTPAEESRSCSELVTKQLLLFISAIRTSISGFDVVFQRPTNSANLALSAIPPEDANPNKKTLPPQPCHPSEIPPSPKPARLLIHNGRVHSSPGGEHRRAVFCRFRALTAWLASELAGFVFTSLGPFRSAQASSSNLNPGLQNRDFGRRSPEEVAAAIHPQYFAVEAKSNRISWLFSILTAPSAPYLLCRHSVLRKKLPRFLAGRNRPKTERGSMGRLERLLYLFCCCGDLGSSSDCFVPLEGKVRSSDLESTGSISGNSLKRWNKRGTSGLTEMPLILQSRRISIRSE